MKVWHVQCPVCGFKKLSTDMRKRWDGLMVCEKDWEPRHPIDFYNVKPEDTSVPYVYPNIDGITEDTSGWVETRLCTTERSYGVAGYAIAGCSVAGVGLPLSPL